MYNKIIQKKQNINKRFDEIDKSYMEINDFGNLFKKEEYLIKEVKEVKRKSRYLDYLFLEYDSVKKNISNEINRHLEELNKINLSSSEMLHDSYKQNSYLYNEYKLLNTITDTKEYMKSINDLKQKIVLLLPKIDDKNIIEDYKSIKNEYKNILLFVNIEKKDNTNKRLTNFKNFVVNKKIYLNEIGNLLYKKKLFDNHIAKLEDLYTSIVDYKLKR